MTHQNNIADFLDLPATVLDGRWHVITIKGAEFDYRSAGDTHPDCMYRHNAGHGSSNPVFSLGGNPDTRAKRLDRYLSGAAFTCCVPMAELASEEK